MQTIVRKGSFDSMHRVMNEKFKCFNVHGHTYLYELHFTFEQMKEIGYAVDFKEIKRVACQWIDDHLDHGAILNPKDQHLLTVCSVLNSKVWTMSLNNGEYCNPTVENLAKEIYLAVRFLMRDQGVKLHRVVLYETPNCFTECTSMATTSHEVDNFYASHSEKLEHYRIQKGIVTYDDRIQVDAAG